MGMICISSDRYREYLESEYWERAMARTDGGNPNVIAADWQGTMLCAQFLSGGRSFSLFSDGEYVVRGREGSEPEGFFVRQLCSFFDHVQGGYSFGADRGTVLLVSVPEARLEAEAWLEYAGHLEGVLEPFLGSTQVIFFPRIRVAWEHCGRLKGHWSVVQVLERETQIMLSPTDVTAVSFGSGLAGYGRPQRYYHHPVTYRENNFLYAPDRFLYQKIEYPSWYQGIYQICGKILGEKHHGKERRQLALTGDPDCFSCVSRALSDLDAAEDREAVKIAADIPSFLLEWYCRCRNISFQAEEREGGWAVRPDTGDIWSI